MLFVEASAKTDQNVKDVFEHAAAAVLDGLAARIAASAAAAAAAASAAAS